jgi:hypothetical protein
MSFARFNGGGGSGGGFSRFNSGSVAEDPYNTDKLDNQIQNADTRIQDAGYTPQDGDSRNWFEKLTNLPQHQNFLFDTLELLGRPGNAVKNVLDKAVGSGATESVGEAALKGISGKEKVTGADLAEHRGVENGFGRFLLGTTTDILTDPLTYVPGGVLADGAKAAIKPVGALAKTAYSAAEKIPSFARFSDNTIKPAVESVKDGLGYAFNPNYKIDETLNGGTSNALKDLSQQTDNSRAFMQEEAMKNVSNAAVKAGGIDTGVDVGRVMEQPLRQFEDVKGYEFPDGLQRTTNKFDLVDNINQNKSDISNVSRDIKGTNKEYNGAINEFNSALDQTNKQISKIYFSLERNAGKELDSVTRNNLRQARTEANRLDSQINNFSQVENGMLRDYKKQIRNDHEASFNIVKEIRKVAPNGIKAVGFDLPDKLKPLNSVVGKGIDEVADELGYSSANNLLQDVRRLDGLPRKLSNAEIESKALKEMERTGANQHLADTLQGLKTARDTVRVSLTDVAKNLGDNSKTQLKAFSDLSTHPEYNSLSTQKEALQAQRDSLRNESKLAQQSGVDKIRGLQGTNEDLKQSLQNPVMIQKQIERPVREISNDPKIQQAAKTLMESNNTIRQFAAENGIEIPELEGYMTHVFSQVERDARKVNKPINVDTGSFGNGNPNKSILKQRELMGSVEDINDRLGNPKFEPNAYFATGIGQKRLIDYVHAVSLRRQVLQNPDFATPFIKGMDVPKNAEVIDSNNYSFLKDSGDSLDGVVQKESVGGQYIVTKQAKMVLDRYQKLNTDEGTKAFLKAFDSVQGLWKKGALFSLGYHFRNQAGAMFNNYVGGMNTIDLAKYTPEGFKEVAKSISGKESPMFTEFRKQGLGSSTLSQVEYAKTGQEPEQAIQKTVENMSKDTKGQITQRLNPLNAFQTSAEVGNFFDQANRFALYKWARDKGMTAEDAAQKVRDVQFDYSKTTPFEKNIATRVFPFYRWMRNNVPFQIKSFINDPRKYQFLNKARLNAQQSVGLNEDNIPDYMKEQFAIPLYGKNGKGKMLGLNLPLTDLTKLSSPGKALVDSLSATIKTPAELALNYNTFLGKPIQKFQGQQQQYQIPYTDVAFGIPIKAGYALNQATGQIGRGLSGFLQKPDTKDQDTLNRLPSLGISSMTKPFDAEKYAYYEKLDQLKQAQDLMLFIQQQTGEKPRTLSQIKH